MIYSHEVEQMCKVAQGVNHGAAPIPEEAKWVQSKEIKDILQNILFQYFTFFIEEHRTFSSFLVCQNNLIGLAAILCRFHRRFLDG